jgi:hypothetical protein
MPNSSRDQFFRFLIAAQKGQRSHLRPLFEKMFVTVVRARHDDAASCQLSHGDTDTTQPVSSAPGADEKSGCEVAFVWNCCGSSSVALPMEFNDESEVRCGECGKSLMTWKVFKEYCEARVSRVNHSDDEFSD